MAPTSSCAQHAVGIEDAGLGDARDGVADDARRADAAEARRRDPLVAGEPCRPRGRRRSPIERRATGREQVAPARPVEISEHAVGRDRRPPPSPSDARPRRSEVPCTAAPPGDPGVDSRILRRQADDRGDQLDQPRSTLVRGVVVDDPRQPAQQRVRALRPVAPAFPGEVGGHLHEARALLRAAVLADRELGHERRYLVPPAEPQRASSASHLPPVCPHRARGASRMRGPGRCRG